MACVYQGRIIDESGTAMALEHECFCSILQYSVALVALHCDINILLICGAATVRPVGNRWVYQSNLRNSGTSVSQLSVQPKIFFFFD